MAADYPDVIKAGAAFMGVPYHCFYTNSVKGWNGPCARGAGPAGAVAGDQLPRGFRRGAGDRHRVAHAVAGEAVAAALRTGRSRGARVRPGAVVALAQVRVSRLRPRWLYFAAPGRHRVMAFGPRPGVSVPAVAVFDPLSRRGASSRWGARWQRKWYESTFVVFMHTVDATSEEIVEAVR
jgi:hypothetical protein